MGVSASFMFVIRLTTLDYTFRTPSFSNRIKFPDELFVRLRVKAVVFQENAFAISEVISTLT